MARKIFADSTALSLLSDGYRLPVMQSGSLLGSVRKHSRTLYAPTEIAVNLVRIDVAAYEETLDKVAAMICHL
jgi:hypothetical protein